MTPGKRHSYPLLADEETGLAARGLAKGHRANKWQSHLLLSKPELLTLLLFWQVCSGWPYYPRESTGKLLWGWGAGGQPCADWGFVHHRIMLLPVD